MTIYLHDKRPKRGMLQAAKEQGFEQAMQQVEALEAEIERLGARLSLAERSIQEFKADRNAVIEECAGVAELFSINRTSIYPDLTWDEMNEQAQRVCHTTCQQVAAAIRALKDKP